MYIEVAAHRGNVAEYPENTMPAFRAAYEQGYKIIETDPIFTADGQCVLFHDRTVLRTCRTPEGEPVQERVAAEMTYGELTALDAGRIQEGAILRRSNNGIEATILEA